MRAAALAVADESRPTRLRVTFEYFLNESDFRSFHVDDELPRLRVLGKKGEIDRVAVIQGDADFGILFGSTDPRTMTGPGSKMIIGRFRAAVRLLSRCSSSSCLPVREIFCGR